MLNEIKNLSLGWLLIIVCISYLLIQLIYYKLVLTDTIFEDYYQSLGSSAIVSEVLDLQKSRRWIYIILHQLLVMMKIGIISLALFLGTFFIHKQVSYWLLLKITLLAEVLVVVFELLKLNLLVLKNPGSLQAILQFSPLSLANLPWTDVPKLWVGHLLGNLNLFELAYLLVLSLLVNYCTELNWRPSFRLTGVSYFLCLALWLTLSSLFLFYAEIPN